MTASILPLVLDKLCFNARGERLIHDLTATLHGGTRTILLGPNGAGKSLTLRLAHGLLSPSSGSVRWEGSSAQAAHERQAMVFQRPVMLRRSAAANVDYALSLRGIGRRARRPLVEEALARAGLGDMAKRSARVLSAGEQQRLALARAWAVNPEVLFLDEPTANLDPAATRAVEEMIAAIHESGATIIMTTHDLGQARRVADEILFLHRGHLMEQMTAETFFARPQSAEAQAFLKGDLLW
ncbi:MAG: ATP-binding cassette domain-containing protein [Alphaproteobacteria bacterium]|jgi:tungstate transport system ATP-binding protein|nr:ABC transporter ATP-binding protein [Rhodospirillaceae bacterium]MDP6031101.1 ATP-binding cassette domain-containing protein [Alphaproteobacteria bacterium]MDP7182979.1 ATP-binding cassette domain-containing protein [Alphaproteobacteria bacterium]MDP7190453.1 ATP-binding cassette domain-containing protein [Alphaproteobacteria bacterium]MDP7456344.1 ATP-binding cassette domain-containing protein [Alphaproteobacteria bacterium]|tara:strand:+ start:264 stop:983 length:720 start_codon:yes stop_codon:yes gene_type:complete